MIPLDVLLALELGAIGISYVFIFLAILIFLLYLNAWLIQFLSADESDEDEQAAAATAVAIHHRRRK